MVSDEIMDELIEDAKYKIIEWHDPSSYYKINRKFIETCIWSDSIKHGNGAGSLIKLFVLEGGEAKGTILADYFNGVVIAYDRTFTQIEILRAKN